MRGPALLIPCLIGLSCADPPAVVATVSDLVPTVVTVTFEGIDPGSEAAFVEVTSGSRFEVSPADDGTAEVVVWGLKQDTGYELGCGVVLDGADQELPILEVSTGSAPADLPVITVDAPGEPLEGAVLTTLLGSSSGAVVVDGDGDYLWWHLLEDADLTTNRAVVAADGRSILIRVNHVDGPSRGIRRVALDGRVLETVDTCAEAHHDFVELPDGAVAYFCHDTREIDGEDVVGDRLVERAPDGVTRDVWFVWDHWDFDPDQGQDPHWGYAHANALDFLPAQDAYTLSSRKLDTIFLIQRDTGDVTWRFGGELSDFVPADALTAMPVSQHQHQLLGDHLLVFDNGPPDATDSRAVEYRLDTAAMTAAQVFTYYPDPPLYSYAYGDVSRLDDGSTLVTFSVSGQMDLVDAHGELRWRINAPFGWAFGYSDSPVFSL